MNENDPRLTEKLDRFYDHVEGETPPAALEQFDPGAAGRHQRVVHMWAGVAGVAAVAAAVGALVVGLGSHHPSPQPAPASSHSPAASTPSSMPSPTPSPIAFANFQPVAFSAISESQYWVLGYDGTTCAPCNAVLLHTTDGGKTFEAISAPPVQFKTTGAQTVDGIRFADASDGYVYGSALWVTHDGGAHWHALSLGGSVPQLEPGAGGYVYAVVHQCPPGGNPGGGSPCYDSVVRWLASSESWKILPGVDEHDAIGVHGNSLWVMQFGSGKLSVSMDAGDTFSTATFPCVRGLDGALDPVSSSIVWAFCVTGTEGGPVVSTNGGRTWSSQRDGFSNGGGVAGVSASTAFATNGAALLQVTHDGGVTYSAVLDQPSGGPVWVGFTDASVGYLVAGNPNGAPGMQLWRTADGGAYWSRVSFAG